MHQHSHRVYAALLHVPFIHKIPQELHSCCLSFPCGEGKILKINWKEIC